MVLCLLLLVTCAPDDPGAPRQSSLPVSYHVVSDKAVYAPGETVRFTLTPSPSNSLRVRYKHLNRIVEETTVSGTSWTWSTPPVDFTGYMVELSVPEGESEKVVATIGIDVSSRWTKFPRYGFLSKFPAMTEKVAEEVIDNLTRYRINGIQFYDWHFKHHQPLAGTPESPVAVYRDIINREIYFETVERYIGLAHERGIKAMFYNLVYGALKDAYTAGVQEEWYVYTDNLHSNKDKHPLAPPFTSDIYLVDPSHTAWQEYLAKENRKVYEALPFDGFHMDQLGDRGMRYRYNGSPLYLSETFGPFIEAMKADAPDKAIVMNAVNQYGQQTIASAPVDFLYTEVWGPNDSYADLANIILQNKTWSPDKNTVLAAYVNYDRADHPGFFNTPSVLLADAVIFAFGGAHIELGEHMLGKEYFPNNNLAMEPDLQRKLITYYDFMTAYQNLLRDGGEFNTPSLTSADGHVQYAPWPPQTGKVAVVGKEVGQRQVIHLINFMNAKTLHWRDNNGIQPSPVPVENLRFRITVPYTVKKVWCASPDFDGGSSRELAFDVDGSQITFLVPWLQYWDMIVIEYQ